MYLANFARIRFRGDNFFTIPNDYGSGFIFKKHSMQYCPKCGRELPKNGEKAAVIIPFPHKPSPRMKAISMCAAQ